MGMVNDQVNGGGVGSSGIDNNQVGVGGNRPSKLGGVGQAGRLMVGMGVGSWP